MNDLLNTKNKLSVNHEMEVSMNKRFFIKQEKINNNRICISINNLETAEVIDIEFCYLFEIQQSHI